jgi:WD40 repeat protein
MNWNPVWSPDGRWLYFSSDRGGWMNLWRVPIDASGGGSAGPPIPVSISTEQAHQFDIAADGGIVFASLSSSNAIRRRAIDIEQLTVADEVETLIEGNRSIASGNVSPDGRWVAFQGTEETEDLFILATDGSGLRRLTNDPFKDRGPRWTADSERMLFYSTRSGRYETWSIGADGGDPRQHTQTAEGRMYNPVPSPDGRRAVAHTDDGAALFDIDADGPVANTEPFEPMESGVRFFASAWSPDGRFTAGVPVSGKGIYVYSIEDRSYRRISEDGSPPIHYLPGGKALVFMRRGEILFATLDGAVSKPAFRSVASGLAGVAEGFIYYVTRDTESDIWLLGP